MRISMPLQYSHVHEVDDFCHVVVFIIELRIERQNISLYNLAMVQHFLSTSMA